MVCRPMLLLPSLLLAAPAHAKPLGWLLDGADRVDLATTTDLVLYRGPETRYLPAVAVKVPVPEQEALRSTLAVVDLANGWSTLTLEAANALGVAWEWEQVRGEWHRLATLKRVEAGNLVLHEVHVEVITEGPAPFVLGVTALGIGAAIVPSAGVVRFAPERESDQLLNAIAEPIEVKPQPTSSWTDHGTTFRGNGVTLRVPGALRWGEAVSEGTFHVSTARPTSRVARSSRLPAPIRRASAPYHEVEASLGGAWLDHTWILETEELSDPDPVFAAELGYDVLYGLDIAVAGQRMAFAKADTVRFTPARDVAVPMARERYDQEEKRRPTEAPVEGRVQIGFDGPTKSEVPLGDPGDPVIRDRNLDLAETLWFAGELDAALPYYLAASQHAGDHCLTHLRLAQRRLAWSGTQQVQSFVVDLIRQPLERAGAQWDAWLTLDEPTRTAIWEGQNRPDATVQVYQPLECQQSWGLLLASYSAQGNDEAADAIAGRYQGRHASVDYARGVRLLARGELGPAQPLLASAKERAGVEPVDAQAALVLTWAPSSSDKVKTLARDLAHYSSDHELATAFAALEAGRASDDPQGLARALRRADDRWLPGALVTAIALGEPPPPWDERIAQRMADAPQVEAWRAVHQALSGDIEAAKATLKARRAPAVADWWTAKAVVAWLAGDEAGRVEALKELHLRFPLLPGGELGTLSVAPPPEPEPTAKKKRR